MSILFISSELPEVLRVSATAWSSCATARPAASTAAASSTKPRAAGDRRGGGMNARTQESPLQARRRQRTGAGPGCAIPCSVRWPRWLLLLLIDAVLMPGFFHLEIKDGHLYGSLVDILNRAAPLMLAALGMTLVIATRGIDISVGAVVALAGTVAAC
jgi:hypothetical protein